MSMAHGAIVVQKPIGKYAKHMRNLIPANIPEVYTLRPEISNIADEKVIRDGVIAFRDFLYDFCDRLISDGNLYALPRKTINPSNYPFLHYINHLLIDIGYHGNLATDGGSLLVTQIPSFTGSKNKTPVSKQAECLRFLTLCGFAFAGIDMDANAIVVSKEQPLAVSYPANPVLAVGLKALSVADMELRTERRYSNDDNLLRCDYSLIKADETDTLDVLKNYLHPLSEKVREFAVALHQRYTDMGIVSVVNKRDGLHIAYANINNNSRVLTSRDVYDRRIWEFAVSIKHGYCLVVRAKKTDKDSDAIEKFPLYLKEKIKQGYGCDRKLRGERCQGGCQGIRIPLDDSILDISREIEAWLDSETNPASVRRECGATRGTQ
ncbi:MAG: hypothetical protein FWH17_00680 [Oscillospiraceae bacterium]|nr:hypothetical protein [Oscillospiraceae bacterium]